MGPNSSKTGGATLGTAISDMTRRFNKPSSATLGTATSELVRMVDGADNTITEIRATGDLDELPPYDISEVLLPTTASEPKHRIKNTELTFNIPACVARPVGKKELERTLAALEARDKEWRRLRSKQVWDESVGREWDDVAKEARLRGEEVDMGRLFGICIEKGSELPADDPRRKFKYRVVFQGNRVVNQNWEVAIFQDLGSSPAAMEAGKAVDCYGCFEGHGCMQADAEQAYVQAELKGPATWVLLPEEA